MGVAEVCAGVGKGGAPTSALPEKVTLRHALTWRHVDEFRSASNKRNISMAQNCLSLGSTGAA